MKDFLKVDLVVGDSVVLMAPNYRSLVIGRTIAETPKNFRIAYENTWNTHCSRYEILQAPSQLVKVDVDTTHLEIKKD